MTHTSRIIPHMTTDYVVSQLILDRDFGKRAKHCCIVHIPSYAFGLVSSFRSVWCCLPACLPASFFSLSLSVNLPPPPPPLSPTLSVCLPPPPPQKKKKQKQNSPFSLSFVCLSSCLPACLSLSLSVCLCVYLVCPVCQRPPPPLSLSVCLLPVSKSPFNSTVSTHWVIDWGECIKTF